jgi:excinuclease ABC subunit A
MDNDTRETYSNLFEADGIEFEEPSEHMFSFNNPFGACPLCEGYGKIIGIDEDLVVPDKRLSVYGEAIVCWKGEKMKAWKDKLISNADKFDFPIHRPYNQLSDEQRDVLWRGNRYFKGLNQFFKHLESKKYKIQYRVMLARYRGKTTCPECKGARLKKEASHVKINKKSVQELVLMSVDKLSGFFENLQLSSHEKGIAERIITEIQNRINFLRDVGLGYLTLNRLSSTLSGGESQRINLATSLGSSLVGSLYILDEPSIGLHPRDTSRLIKVLRNLTGIHNTVIVVEHDEDIIREADHLIDIGPEAGRLGGEIVFEGPIKKIYNKDTLTSAYLSGKEKIKIPASRRKWNSFIEIIGARQNNLKDLSVKFPLNCLTVVSGVSGSGKSTLVCDILFPALNRMVNSTGDQAGAFDDIRGDIGAIEGVEFVDQNPIGRSSRSNPVTYIKAYDEIRKLFSLVPVSKNQGFKPSHFSFNVEGGRCEECQGEGTIKVEMQFMADVYLECENCKGRKFKEEILEATYNGKNIHDVLDMTVNEAIDFFSWKEGTLERKIIEKLSTLQSVGLGYVKLGQSSNTLSGGESQRVKLASFLGKETGSTRLRLFIFDEPTTGLHFHDISKLLDSFNALIERGHSVIVIEHNMEVIKSADWLIDLGPEGGENGGTVVFAGEPEELAKVNGSYTGNYLMPKIK